jgi:hypothetical protein
VCIGRCRQKGACVRQKMAYHSSFTGTLCRCKNSVFPTVVMRAAFFGCIGGLAMYLYENFQHTYEHWVTPNTDMHTYMSMMVAMMIAFRTNNCYGRYDTGVSLTGGLKTHARILVTQAAGYAQGTDQKTLEFVEETRRLTMLFLLFFKRHMHEQVSFDGSRCGSCRTWLPPDRSWLSAWRSAIHRSNKCHGLESSPRCAASERHSNSSATDAIHLSSASLYSCCALA